MALKFFFNVQIKSCVNGLKLPYRSVRNRPPVFLTVWDRSVLTADNFLTIGWWILIKSEQSVHFNATQILLSSFLPFKTPINVNKGYKT
jgi:hypothetical protein